MSIAKTLLPPANREAALVAFLRTFWQVIRPPIVLGSVALAGVATTGVVHVSLNTLGLIAAAAVLSAIVSGLLAAGDILKNGLPNAYQNAAVASIPAAIVSTVPVVTPADPSQPAAGVPPAPIVAAPTIVPAPPVPQAAATGDVTTLPPVTA